MALTFLVRSGYVVVDGATSATKLARLTSEGRAARDACGSLHAALESGWDARFGVRGSSSAPLIARAPARTARRAAPAPLARARALRSRVARECAVRDPDAGGASTTRSRRFPTIRWCCTAAAGRTAADAAALRSSRSEHPASSRACGAQGSRRRRPSVPDRRRDGARTRGRGPGAAGGTSRSAARPGAGRWLPRRGPRRPARRPRPRRRPLPARRRAASRRRDAVRVVAVGERVSQPARLTRRQRRRRRAAPALAPARTARARRMRSPRRRPEARAREARASAASARAGPPPIVPPPSARPGAEATPKRSRRRSTRLTCACASGVSSQMQRAATPWLRRRRDDVVARCAGEVRVVEDDLARALTRAPRRARAASSRERAAALVSVQPQVAPRDVVAGDARLPGSRDAHDDARRRPSPSRLAQRSGARRSQALVARRARGERRRARPTRAVSGRRAPGMATTFGPRPSSQASATSASVAPCACAISSAPRGARACEHGVDPPSGEWAIAAIPSSAQRSTTPPRRAPVVEGADRDLHGRDRRVLEGVVQLRAVDVAHAERADEAVVHEPRERADGRRPRRPRIRSVEEVEVDRQPARAPRGSPRSRRGSPSRDRPGPMRRRASPSRPSSRPARLSTPRSARASSASLPSYARAVSKTVIPASSAAAIVSVVPAPSEPHAAEADAELVAARASPPSAPCRRRGETPRAALPRPRPRAARHEAAARTARAVRGRPRSTTSRRRSRRRGTSP